MRQHERRFRPTVDALEDRITPRVTNLMIDFTFDAGSRPIIKGSTIRSFAEAFGAGAPAFLDFDQNGVVDVADARIASDLIVQRVTDCYRPFLDLHVNVFGVELETSAGAGRRAIAHAKRSRRIQSFVMYVGGRAPEPRILGVSRQAARGFNFEGHGQTFVNSIIATIQGVNPAPTPGDFTQLTAAVIAHEFGHSLGLGYPKHDVDPTNVMGSSGRGGTRFLTTPYSAGIRREPFARGFVFRQQNAVTELVRSFRGQPNENSPGLMFHHRGEGRWQGDGD